MSKSIDHAKGRLFIVGLPIGNPQDITLRALDVLKSVEVIAAEDTRTFSELAHQLKISPKRLIAYHEHNEKESAEGIMHLLVQGQSVAIVSDAGTPGISDPGFRIVKLAHSLGIIPIAIPGVSALTTALSISPIGGRSHYFGGFLHADSKERKRELSEVKGRADRLVFFESPSRIVEFLQDAQEILGSVSATVLRELTKPYEEIRTNLIAELIVYFQQHPPRGECVIILESPKLSGLSAEETRAAILALFEKGMSSRDVREHLQTESVLSRRDLYQLIEELKQQKKES